MMEVQYYKGVHRVRIVTRSEGYWIVEALEDFDDSVNDEKVHVRKGERRIVPVESLSLQKTLLPTVKEHAYELRMEKKLKRLVANDKAEGTET